MSVSSGTVSLFSAVAVAIAAAAGGAYGLKHRDDVKRLVSQFSASHAPGSEDQEQTAALDSSDTANTAKTGDESGANENDGGVTLRAGEYGHFETAADVNGRSIDVMVDTGASLVALTYEDAERAGIFLRTADFTHSVSTANGTAKIAPVRISSISIGGITVRNIEGAVSQPGKLHKTLLGMSFLGRLSRVDMRAKTLVLHE
jgi:aspartyl protease family protein